MTAAISPIRILAFAVLLILGCKKNPDPYHIDLVYFKSPKQLSDTLQYLVGMTEPIVWEAMQRNGFHCGERRGILVDRSTGELGSGKPHLECWQSHRINLGLKRRVWTVQFGLDSGRVTDVTSRFMSQDLG
jgi:hypothetical protein